MRVRSRLTGSGQRHPPETRLPPGNPPKASVQPTDTISSLPETRSERRDSVALGPGHEVHSTREAVPSETAVAAREGAPRWEAWRPMTRVSEPVPDLMSSGMQSIDRPDEPYAPASTPTGRARGRIVAGGLLAVLALVAAVIYAVGPAVAERAVYSWTVDPAAGPPAFTPLQLTASTPETLAVSLPCPTSEADWMEFQTDNVETGLLASVKDETLVVATAGRAMVSTRWAADTACPGEFTVSGTEWTLTGEAGHVIDSGITEPITVSRLAVAGSGAPASAISVNLLTKAYGSQPSSRQIVAFVFAAIAALAALFVIARAERSGGWPRLGSVPIHLGWADVLVVVVVAVWAVLGPALFDDGWFLANQRAFAESGTITDIYWATSSNYPLGYWYQWIWHFWTDQFIAPIYIRFAATGIVVLLWSVVRVSLGLVNPSEEGATWRITTAAIVFVVGSMAWLMTLRPEPLIALLATATLASCLVFRRALSIRSLGVAAILAAAALSVHPAGIVAVAPLFVTLPTMLRWLGKDVGKWVAFAGIAIACSALVVLLAVVDSDLRLKIEAAEAMSQTGATLGFVKEWARYALLVLQGRTPIRYLAVGFAAIAIISLLSQRDRWTKTDAVPTWTLLLSLVLLALVPTKWVWHFGSLAGYVAVAMAFEFASWRRRLTRESTVLLIPVAMISAFVLVAAAVAAEPWNSIDLRSLSWKGLSDGTRLVILGTASAAVAVGSIVWVRRRRRPLREAVTVAMASMLVIASATAVAFTIGLLAADAIVTDGWTFGRQNADALTFSSYCGAADEIMLPARTPGGERASLTQITNEAPELEVFVHPDIALYLPCIHHQARSAGVWPVADILITQSQRAVFLPKTRPQDYQQYDRDPFTVLLGESYYSGTAPEYGSILIQR